MNNQTPSLTDTEPPIQIIVANQTENKIFNRWLVVFMLIGLFIVSSIVGLMVSTINKPTLPPKTAPSSIQPASLLMLPSTLTQNSVLSNWSAQIDGLVTAKTKSSFLISKAIISSDFQGTLNLEQIQRDQELEIIYVSNQTIFEKEGQEEKVNLTLQDLALGSIVSGSVEFEKANEGWRSLGQHFLIRNLHE